MRAKKNAKIMEIAPRPIALIYGRFTIVRLLIGSLTALILRAKFLTTRNCIGLVHKDIIENNAMIELCLNNSKNYRLAIGVVVKCAMIMCESVCR